MAINSDRPAGAHGHFTAVIDAMRDRRPNPAVAYCLAGRTLALLNLGRVAEAGDDARRSLTAARELGCPAGEAAALGVLSLAAAHVGDPGGALQLARQAGQIPGDISGWVARLRSACLTIALTEAGDLAAARHACMAGLAAARAAGDQGALAETLNRMAMLDLRAAGAEDAAACLREALQIADRADMPLTVDNALNCCGYLCAATGRHLEAVTVWAAADVFWKAFAGAPAEARRRDEARREARQALGPARTRAAEERGAAMSRPTATEYALLLTLPDWPTAAAPGPGALSARERELVTLVAQGRTNAQIAAQLYISVHTVRSHLDRIRDKTSCRRRADLTRLALSAGLV